ncbi:MAG: hypothetical protein KKA42_06710 [candidate division Zixibacteria bacterium]|nr:hypothetical protein [candidate division Zixibacteria bacterium]
MSRKTITLIVTILLLGVCATHTQEPEDVTSFRQKAVRLLDPQLVERLSIDSLVVDIERVKLIDTTTPFFHSELDGRSVVRVHLKNAPVTADDQSLVRDFIFYFDASTGTFLKLTSELPSFADKLATGDVVLPHYRVYEKYLSQGFGQSFDGLATPDTGVSLFEILDVVPGRPVRCADLIVVVFAAPDQPDNADPVWIVETWGGFTTIPSGGGSIGTAQASYLRTIVDRAGHFVEAMN